ncbi:hypothetical protein [Photobacterium damselae]|uniref:hypothetical protein n=1 Tax=Photobacterium damselae TaxID=38293 RepID=UPI000D662B51|nr:hypothetical protein [Photobacterium damselae]AWK83819.1 hypothetical protein BST98_17580 [Photobacterium damselae]
MGFDTRGFMDGALRGFDTVSRIQDRQEAREQQKEDRIENNRRWQESHDQSLKQAAQAQENWNKSYELQQKNEQDQTDYRNKMLGLSYADKKLKQEMHDFTMAKAQKDAFYQDQQHFINNNAALLDNAWTNNLKTGEIDPIFNSPFVKGTQWDVTRYDDKTVKAYRNIELNLPDVIQGRSNIDESMLNDLSTVLKGDLLREVKGSKDATGTKIIDDVNINGIHIAADINPELEGAQPGLVLNLDLTYKDEDGNISKGEAPLTEARSTSSHDNVKVIPVEKMMQYLSQGMQLSRSVDKSQYYNQIFHPDTVKKNQELEKEYRQYFGKVELGRAKAIAEALKNTIGGTLTEEQMAVINKPFDEQLANAQGLFSSFGMKDIAGKQEVTALPREDLWKIKGDLVGSDPLKSQYFEPFTQWVTEQGANVNYALKDKDTAKTLFASYMKIMKEKTATDNFNYAVGEGMGRQGRGDNNPRSAITSPIDYSKYEPLSNEQLIGLTQDGDMNAWKVLYDRNNNARSGEMQAPLPGKTSQQQRDDAAVRLQEYQRLLSKGKTNEANKALSEGLY